MARLNGQDYPFKPKSGLAANVNSTANKNSAYDGEIVYTTDGKQLYVFNGTEFEEVNKYTQYFYNSSGAQAGNRFNDWGDLQTSIGARKVEIQFEQNETIPAGEYNVNNQTWLGGGTNPNEGFIITLPTGVTFSSAINWGATGGLDIRSTSNAPIHVQDYVTTHVFDRCDIGSTTAPFFQVTVNGLHAWSITQGGIIRNRGYEVIEATGTTAYNCYIIISRQGVEAGPENDTVRSDVEIVFLDLVQSSEGATGASTQANLFAGSALQYILFAKANAIGFKDGKPTGISSDNVFDALAELAASKLQWATVPASAAATGTAGQIAYDASYIYICTATDTWRRIAHATW